MIIQINNLLTQHNIIKRMISDKKIDFTRHIAINSKLLKLLHQLRIWTSRFPLALDLLVLHGLCSCSNSIPAWCLIISDHFRSWLLTQNLHIIITQVGLTCVIILIALSPPTSCFSLNLKDIFVGYWVGVSLISRWSILFWAITFSVRR